MVFTTTTACVDPLVAPLVTPTVGFHPEMVPSMVEKRKSAGAPAAQEEIRGAGIGYGARGSPLVGKVLLVGSALGMVTTSGVMTPAPL